MNKPSELSARNVTLLSGPIAAGKTTLSRLLADRLGFHIVSTRELLGRGERDRRILQAAGADWDAFTAGWWVRDGLVQRKRQHPGQTLFVVDSVRTPDQVRWIRETFQESVKHVHLTASLDTLQRRYNARSERHEYEDVRNHPVEQSADTLKKWANLVVNTGCLNEEAILERVVSWLGLTS